MKPEDKWPLGWTLLLLHLRDSGHSFTEIGKQMGVSRSTISGKIYRLKLKEQTRGRSL